jgi:hypothetical protein
VIKSRLYTQIYTKIALENTIKRKLPEVWSGRVTFTCLESRGEKGHIHDLAASSVSQHKDKEELPSRTRVYSLKALQVILRLQDNEDISGS